METNFGGFQLNSFPRFPFFQDKVNARTRAYLTPDVVKNEITEELRKQKKTRNTCIR